MIRINSIARPIAEASHSTPGPSLSGLTMPSIASVGSTSAEQLTGHSVDQLIQGLGNSNYRTRELSQRELVRRGPDIREALLTAYSSGEPNPEGRRRLELILENQSDRLGDSTARDLFLGDPVQRRRAIEFIEQMRRESTSNDPADGPRRDLAQRVLSGYQWSPRLQFQVVFLPSTQQFA